MKNIPKLLFIFLMILLTVNVNAVEQEEQINQNSSSEISEQKEKIYLSSLSLSSGNIDFDKNIFNYETKVLYDIENIEILAIPEDENAQIDIIGNKKLLVGQNKIEVKITLNDKTTSYIIMVTRLEEGKTLGNNPNIKNIEIKNYNIEFKPDKTEYKLVIKNEEKLDIKITMEDQSSIYEITGNNNLKDGSIIKIKTTSSDETEKIYTITVTKSNYVPYIIITILVLSIPIIIILINYLKSVNKKENVDINGYKIGKEYIDPLTSRKVISNEKTKKEQLPNKETKKPKISKLKSPKTYTTKLEDKIGLDNELKSYDSNEKK